MIGNASSTDSNKMHLNILISSNHRRGSTRRRMADIAPVKTLRNSPDGHKRSSCIVHFCISLQSYFHYHTSTNAPSNRELIRADSSTPPSEIQTAITSSKILNKVKSTGLLKVSDSTTWDRGVIRRSSKQHREPTRGRCLKFTKILALPKTKRCNKWAGGSTEVEPKGAGSLWQKTRSDWLWTSWNKSDREEGRHGTF